MVSGEREIDSEGRGKCASEKRLMESEVRGRHERAVCVQGRRA